MQSITRFQPTMFISEVGSEEICLMSVFLAYNGSEIITFPASFAVKSAYIAYVERTSFPLTLHM